MLCNVRERGQGLVEYAFIILLVVILVIAVLLILGPIVGNMFTKVNSNLPR
jgi:Flp pilus assembly pilin Flp